MNKTTSSRQTTVDAILDRLIRNAKRCERSARTFSAEAFDKQFRQIIEAATDLGNAWSGSWIGPHALIYLDQFRPARAGEHFDSEWGLIGSNHTTGPWCQYTFEAVINEIARRCKLQELPSYKELTDAAEEVFEEAKAEVLPALDAVLATQDDRTLKEKRDEAAKLKPRISASDFNELSRPKQFFTRDSFAMSQGIWIPPHISVQSAMFSVRSHERHLNTLAGICRYVVNYLEMRYQMGGKSVAKTSGKIFIGHGRSLVWKDLKDFLRDTLNLEWDEFNRESSAGLSTKDRLEAMMDEACFAFLVMTAEDEQADGSMRARENVIHEAGLFQGRFGFERAIILLEEGCGEFSNVHGIGQIRFPKGNVRAKTEEIRGVLRREKIIS